MDEQATTELTATTQKALEWVERQRQRIIDCDARCRIVEQAVEQFECCKAARVATAIVEVSLDCQINSLHELTPVFRFLGQHGYHQAMEPHDHAWGRLYYFEKKGFHDRITMVVMVGEKSQCRPVQIGERRQPVYKMKCDGDSAEPERTHEPSHGVKQGEQAAGGGAA